jgi:hypothetical protein
MRRTNLIRRLESLEKEYPARERKDSLGLARNLLWRVVFAYYLGDLKWDERWEEEEEEQLDEHSGAFLRALKYPSDLAWREAMNDMQSLVSHFQDAYNRLFAKVGLDFANTPRTVLFDAFVRMVDDLPDGWLNWLRSRLQNWCSDVEIAAGSNVPRQLSGDNFLEIA